MFHPQHNGGVAGGPLEDHLRNLILANNSNDRFLQESPTFVSAAAPGPVTGPSVPALAPTPGSSVPLVPASVTAMPPAGGAMLASPTALAASPTTRPGQTTPSSPRSARRRPNQAQRRQMSAQLSVPVDWQSSSVQQMGSFASPPLHGNHAPFRQNQPYQPHQHNQHNQQRQQHQHQHALPSRPDHNFHGPPSYQNNNQQSQRPQSATLRPSHYGHGPGSTSLSYGRGSDRSYPSQPRHQQSLSYQGPLTYDDPYNWRSNQGQQQQQQFHQQQIVSPQNTTFSRNGSSRPPHNQNGRMYHAKPEDILAQATSLESLCEQILASAEIAPAEIQEKETFRVRIEGLCQMALAKYELEVNGRADFPPLSVRLKCFGSLSSGFATKASDMDLGLISPLSIPQPDFPKSPVPRIIEKAFLEAGLGARLLSRTRVPIIKLCEKPPEKLRLDLLDERAKWEKGGMSDHDDMYGEDDAAEEADNAAVTATAVVSPATAVATAAGAEENGGAAGASGAPPTNGKPKHAHKESDPDSGREGEDKGVPSLSSLKQPPGQSLNNYHATAKRLLRKLGGRDVSHSTVRDFHMNDLKLLTALCHAFVSGLADDELRTRLLATRSLSSSGSPSQLSYRSLYGVFMQVEGERLAMLWDKRQIHEKDSHLEEEASNKIRLWNDLQNKPRFGSDLLSYNKELHLAVEGLKKIASLQIVTLEQGPYEPPAQYHDRAQKLLIQSGSRDTNNQGNVILPVVVRHYIAGINNADIRTQVESFATSVENPSLRAIARRHKSLQLALEFERALAKGYYNEDDVHAVEAYMEVLRLPLEKCDLLGRRFDYTISPNEKTAAIISRARQLADPHKFAPNQPRDPYRDRLELPKTGAGVQCDINFSAHLGLQNTLLLRCYSHSDPRVRPLVLFVKHWAKVRDINTPYRGTLSSYGYVLMMLHYLVNIAQPFVCPNLQELGPKPPPEGLQGLSPEEIEETITCRGRDVRFWRNEEEIKGLAAHNMLNQNTDSIGHLLRGFFEYYAQNSPMSTVPCRGFDWGRDVLSLRTQGGLRSKQEKGWTGARTVVEVREQSTGAVPTAIVPAANGGHGGNGSMPSVGNGSPTITTANANNSSTVEMKEVKHRFLFAIEDPFELDHNVARTVTHSGIVAIRDEFRRAWRIIKNTGKAKDENLLDGAGENKAKERDHFAELLNDIHGPELSLR